MLVGGDGYGARCSRLHPISPAGGAGKPLLRVALKNVSRDDRAYAVGHSKRGGSHVPTVRIRPVRAYEREARAQDVEACSFPGGGVARSVPAAPAEGRAGGSGSFPG